MSLYRSRRTDVAAGAAVRAEVLAFLLDLEPGTNRAHALEVDPEWSGWEIAEWLVGAEDHRRVHDVWRLVAEQLVAEVAAAMPGRRPASWFLFDAPRATVEELREVGVDYGLEAWQREYVPTLRRPVGHRGRLRRAYVPVFRYGMPAAPMYLENPGPAPLYESQAAYLKRLGLFLPGEERRLRAADLQPEAMGGVTT